MTDVISETQRDWDWTTPEDLAEGPALSDAGATLLLSPATLAQEAARPRLEPVSHSLPDAAYLDASDAVEIDAPGLSRL